MNRWTGLSMSVDRFKERVIAIELRAHVFRPPIPSFPSIDWITMPASCNGRQPPTNP